MSEIVKNIYGIDSLSDACSLQYASFSTYLPWAFVNVQMDVFTPIKKVQNVQIVRCDSR